MWWLPRSRLIPPLTNKPDQCTSGPDGNQHTGGSSTLFHQEPVSDCPKSSTFIFWIPFPYCCRLKSTFFFCILKTITLYLHLEIHSSFIHSRAVHHSCILLLRFYVFKKIGVAPWTQSFIRLIKLSLRPSVKTGPENGWMEGWIHFSLQGWCLWALTPMQIVFKYSKLLCLSHLCHFHQKWSSVGIHG